MAQVVTALGSNLNDRLRYMREAKNFLEELSNSSVLSSSIYESEPVGPSEFEFLNGVILIETDLSPKDLLKSFKDFEHSHDRPTRYPKWTPRTIDLDIICYDDLHISDDKLEIPHPEYANRRFVLEPLAEILPDFNDPVSGKSIKELLIDAPLMKLVRTSLSW